MGYNDLTRLKISKSFSSSGAEITNINPKRVERIKNTALKGLLFYAFEHIKNEDQLDCMINILCSPESLFKGQSPIEYIQNKGVNDYSSVRSYIKTSFDNNFINSKQTKDL